ncbi:hypothetical protein K0B96_14160 [Horticoccus luteus]|uniref:DUF1579 domain-containing protein n=1 Tax=Horticoccus luteus TaxID=2862869 RepID=A0A8F9XKV4_9BACT|nr:hypothetical protein [Horticoccus luteus]QYM78429.1 hypothetical protein K0B96_14160 [Horticoccus luteus]
MYRVILFWAALLSVAATAEAANGNPQLARMAGTWRMDPAASVDLAAWQTMDLTIAVDGGKVTLTRHLAAGRRSYDEVTALDLAKDVNVVPLPWWSANRHLGAYSGGDHTKKVRVQLLEGGRILRTTADFVLDTQQGPHPVNVITDYRLSASGTQLTVIELRSTRNQPLVYVFKRPGDKSIGTAVDGENAE